MERFACKTLVVSGEDSLSVLKEQNCGRLLIAAEPEFLHTEQIRQIVNVTGSPDTEYLEETDFQPSMKQAVEGSRRIKAFCPDLVVAFGDRNVLDCVKAMVCFSGISGRLAVIPTSFCSGSEVTDRVILAHNGRRHLLKNAAMRPAMAILDSEMTVRTPQSKMAEDGFELLADALEAFVSPTGGLFSNLHGREAFASGWAALPAAFAGKERARQRLMTASVLTGMAVNQTGLGLCSAMENSLSSVFGISRGKLAGILMPAIIGCNAHASGRRYAELSRAAGLGGSREEIGIRNLKAGLVRMRRELGLPGTLVQAGVDLRSVWNNGKRIVDLTLEDPECRNNPVVVDDFMVRRILEEITGRI